MNNFKKPFVVLLAVGLGTILFISMTRGLFASNVVENKMDVVSNQGHRLVETIDSAGQHIDVPQNVAQQIARVRPDSSVQSDDTKEKPQVQQNVAIQPNVASQQGGVNWKHVHVFDIVTGSNQSSSVNPFKCVDLNVGIVPNSPICVYDPKVDQWVSGGILQHGAWEPDLIRIVVLLLRKNPQLDFLDIGCNIGIYTVAVSKDRRKVTGIDANIRNLRFLSKSLMLGKINENVTLLWNAISDKLENVTFKEEAKNVGGTQMVSGKLDFTKVDDEHKAVAVTLDDLIPMFKGKSLLVKMDIEKLEMQAFKGGSLFFQQVDVPYLIMEIMHHRTLPTGMEIIRYMTQRSYKPYDPRQLPKLLDPAKLKQWPSDVIWIRDGQSSTLTY